MNDLLSRITRLDALQGRGPEIDRSLLTPKGRAAPSSAVQTAAMIKPHNAKTEAAEPIASNNLSGLIKRANPIKKKIIQIDPPIPTDKPGIQGNPLIRFIDRAMVKSAKPIKPIKIKRRQLTVRISMAQFDTLNQHALKTGKSYQALQLQALEEFLQKDITL